MLCPCSEICSGYAINPQSRYRASTPPRITNPSIRRRWRLVGSIKKTLNGNRKGRIPCAYRTYAAPALCATCDDRFPSSPSHTNPSINSCTANRHGAAASSSSLRCFTSASVATPTAPRTALPTKSALAEKHMQPSLHAKAHHTREERCPLFDIRPMQHQRNQPYRASFTCCVTQSVQIASSIGHATGVPSSTALTKFSTAG